MPYIEMPESSFEEEIRQRAREFSEQGRFFSSTDISELLERREENDVIGYGQEALVLSVKGKEDLVAAYSYREGLSPEDAKRIFYTQRIFSTLFPHNFPRFYAAFGSKEGESPSGTIRERVKPPTQEQRSFRRTIMRKLKKESFVKYSFREVEAECQKFGVNLRVYDDWPGEFDNFMIGADGGEYFVDTIAHNLEALDFNPDRILTYMAEHSYSDQDMRVIKSCIERLQQIRQEKGGEEKKSNRDALNKASQ